MLRIQLVILSALVADCFAVSPMVAGSSYISTCLTGFGPIESSVTFMLPAGVSSYVNRSQTLTFSVYDPNNILFYYVNGTALSFTSAATVPCGFLLRGIYTNNPVGSPHPVYCSWTQPTGQYTVSLTFQGGSNELQAGYYYQFLFLMRVSAGALSGSPLMNVTLYSQPTGVSSPVTLIPSVVGQYQNIPYVPLVAASTMIVNDSVALYTNQSGSYSFNPVVTNAMVPYTPSQAGAVGGSVANGFGYEQTNISVQFGPTLNAFDTLATSFAICPSPAAVMPLMSLGPTCSVSGRDSTRVTCACASSLPSAWSIARCDKLYVTYTDTVAFPQQNNLQVSLAINTSSSTPLGWPGLFPSLWYLEAISLGGSQSITSNFYLTQGLAVSVVTGTLVAANAGNTPLTCMNACAALGRTVCASFRYDTNDLHCDYSSFNSQTGTMTNTFGNGHTFNQYDYLPVRVYDSPIGAFASAPSAGLFSYLGVKYISSLSALPTGGGVYLGSKAANWFDLSLNLTSLIAGQTTGDIPSLSVLSITPPPGLYCSKISGLFDTWNSTYIFPQGQGYASRGVCYWQLLAGQLLVPNRQYDFQVLAGADPRGLTDNTATSGWAVGSWSVSGCTSGASSSGANVVCTPGATTLHPSGYGVFANATSCEVSDSVYFNTNGQSNNAIDVYLQVPPAGLTTVKLRPSDGSTTLFSSVGGSCSVVSNSPHFSVNSGNSGSALATCSVTSTLITIVFGSGVSTSANQGLYLSIVGVSLAVQGGVSGTYLRLSGSSSSGAVAYACDQYIQQTRYRLPVSVLSGGSVQPSSPGGAFYSVWDSGIPTPNQVYSVAAFASVPAGSTSTYLNITPPIGTSVMYVSAVSAQLQAGGTPIAGPVQVTLSSTVNATSIYISNTTVAAGSACCWFNVTARLSPFDPSAPHPVSTQVRPYAGSNLWRFGFFNVSYEFVAPSMNSLSRASPVSCGYTRAFGAYGNTNVNYIELKYLLRASSMVGQSIASGISSLVTASPTTSVFAVSLPMAFPINSPGALKTLGSYSLLPLHWEWSRIPGVTVMSCHDYSFSVYTNGSSSSLSRVVPSACEMHVSALNSSTTVLFSLPSGNSVFGTGLVPTEMRVVLGLRNPASSGTLPVGTSIHYFNTTVHSGLTAFDDGTIPLDGSLNLLSCPLLPPLYDSAMYADNTTSTTQAGTCLSVASSGGPTFWVQSTLYVTTGQTFAAGTAITLTLPPLLMTFTGIPGGCTKAFASFSVNVLPTTFDIEYVSSGDIYGCTISPDGSSMTFYLTAPIQAQLPHFFAINAVSNFNANTLLTQSTMFATSSYPSTNSSFAAGLGSTAYGASWGISVNGNPTGPFSASVLQLVENRPIVNPCVVYNAYRFVN